MTRARPLGLAPMLLATLVSCSATPADDPARKPAEPDVARKVPPYATSLSAVWKQYEADDRKAFFAPVLGGNHGNLYYFVVRGQLDPRRHLRHEVTLLFLEGAGSLRVGVNAHVVQPGLVAFVPAGTTYAYVHHEGAETRGLALYGPSYFGDDVEAVDEPAVPEKRPEGEPARPVSR